VATAHDLNESIRGDSRGPAKLNDLMIEFRPPSDRYRADKGADVVAREFGFDWEGEEAMLWPNLSVDLRKDLLVIRALADFVHTGGIDDHLVGGRNAVPDFVFFVV
jgi:hypothetical protein